MTSQYDFSQGDISTLTGVEINMWVLPYITTTDSAFFMVISNDVRIGMSYDTGTTNRLSLKMQQGLNTISQVLPSASNSKWINLNIIVSYGNYIQFNAWQGDDWYELNPSLRLSITPCPYYTNNGLSILNTAPTIGVYWTELRVFSQEQDKSWAQYLRHYGNPVPFQFTMFLKQMYITSAVISISDGLVTGPSQYDLSMFTLLDFPLVRCVLGYALSTDGFCNDICLTTKCMACQTIDSNFYNLCKYCDPSSDVCVTQYKCPNDYYNENGICNRCPVGCSACTNSTYCGTCDAGLVIYSAVEGSQNCQCSDGQFGLISGDTISCALCDDNCKTCYSTSVNCTSCNSPLFYMNGMCIADCSTAISNYYGEVSTRTCTTCPVNCLACTSAIGCTNCKNSTSPATPIYNFQGLCVGICPLNSIADVPNLMCNKCSDHCSSCNLTTTNCTSCDNDYNLFNNAGAQAGVCISNCPTGWYGDSKVCKRCDVSCTVCSAVNYCTSCLIDYIASPQALYYFINFQCRQTCPDKFYPDSTDPNYLFCRSCPSGCLTCSTATLCTQCLTTYYMRTTSATNALCVQPTDCKNGYYANAGTLACAACKANCQTCTTGADCQACFFPYLLDPTGTCVSSCPTGTYPNQLDVCNNCISNCQQCSDSYTCDICNSGYLQLQGLKTCVSTSCPAGYYQSTQQCLLCPSQCQTCSSSSVCTGCVMGYTLSGSNCLVNCGNGIRQDIEQCDDANLFSLDGCSSTCNVEPGYICSPSDPSTTGPDICRCDPSLVASEWIDYWGSIRLTFASGLYFYSASSTQSDDPKIFCDQIISPATIATLGSYYECYLWSTSAQTQLYINVASDSILGNNGGTFKTSITLLDGALKVQGYCSLYGIPTMYSVKNLPIATPTIQFNIATGSQTVSLCQTSLSTNILPSKGFTKRDITVAWTIISMSPSDINIQNNLANGALAIAANQKYFTLQEADVESLKGKTVVFKVTVSNFLGNIGTNSTSVVFSNSKYVEIYDLPDVITLQASINNTLYPRLRLSYCQSESTSTKVSDQQQLSYICELSLLASPATKITLTNCTIPANTMALSAQYLVKVTAKYATNQAYNSIKNVVINPAAPTVYVAGVQGCNRLFSANKTFSLKAIYNTNSSYALFTWNCIDVATGSTCFSTNYKYISFSNTENITVSSGLFYSGMQYLFGVQVTDTLTGTSSSTTCLMWSALQNETVIDLGIESEANINGFVNFNTMTNSFKASIANMATVNTTNLKFTWTISDASGKVFDNSYLTIYRNSISVNTTFLKRNNQYTVQLSATDGISRGNISVIYQTDPSDVSIEFFIEPASGIALSTVFSLEITSQQPYDGLFSYVYGYINPVDGITQMPLFQKSSKKNIQSTLPKPSSSTSLTCYVTVIKPNGASKTYYKIVTVSAPTMTSTDLMNQVPIAIMDDLIEGIQMKDKLMALSSTMTQSQIAQTCKTVLYSLKSETTPLSDLFIQTSVSSIIEYISTQLDQIASIDPSIVTDLSLIFNKMTIDENTQISVGQYVKFNKGATDSLFNYANNVFQKDFSSLIGQQQNKNLKNSIMQGLKNVLKGSLSNLILGDNGGYGYQGKNLYAKAVKFDQLETNFTIAVKLPQSISGSLSRNKVIIALPNATSSQNPCKGYKACQLSVIILDSPVNTFISNSKDSELKSMFVDLSIQNTEMASPNSYINIQDVTVTGLTQPITFSVPINSALSGKENKTLGCGYLDETDNIFKDDGLTISMIDNTTVYCYATHLTAIGVEEYTDESAAQKANNGTDITDLPYVDTSTTQPIFQSWAVWVSMCLLVLMVIGILWGYKRDKRDEINYEQVKNQKNKLYVGLFLDPIEKVEKHHRKDSKKLFSSTRQLEEDKKKSMGEEQYQQLQDVNNNDETQRIQDLNPPSIYKPAPLEPYRHEPVKLILNQDFNEIPLKNLEDDVLANTQGLAFAGETGMSKRKVVKKKKKKKKKGLDSSRGMAMDDSMSVFRQNRMFQGSNNNAQDEDNEPRHDIFFEGGSEDGIFYYEGGDDEENKTQMTEGEDEAALTIKSKRIKKKKGSKRKKSVQKKNSGGSQKTDGDEEGQDTMGVSVRSGRSSKSANKKKKKGTKKNKESSEVEQNKMFSNQVGFKKNNDEEEGDQTIDELNVTTTKLKKKNSARSLSRKGSRALSRSSSRGSRHGSQEFPDIEAAEIINPKKKGSVQITKKEDLLKPVNDKKNKKKRVDVDEVAEVDLNAMQNANKQNKNKVDDEFKSDRGFDTLMGEENNKSRPDSPAKSANGELRKSLSKQKSLKRTRTVKTSVTPAPLRAHQEAAGCCVMCCWTFKEAHRCIAIYRHFNEYLSRVTRVVMLIMSFFNMIMITGFLMSSDFKLVAEKDVINEQVACGLLAALLSKVWVSILSNIMRHHKIPTRFLKAQSYHATKAKRRARLDKIRYWVGMSLAIISMITSMAFIFIFSINLLQNVILEWAFAFLFCLIMDFIILEFAIVIANVFILLIVGAAPDSCGPCRNCWLYVALQAAKDSVK